MSQPAPICLSILRSSAHDTCVIFHLRLSRRMVSFCLLRRHTAIDVSWSGFTMQWQELVELRMIPDVHLSNCAWIWYKFMSCFCRCAVQCCNRSAALYACAIVNGILARKIQTTKKTRWWPRNALARFFGLMERNQRFLFLWSKLRYLTQSSLTLRHCLWTPLIPPSNIINIILYRIVLHLRLPREAQLLHDAGQTYIDSHLKLTHLSCLFLGYYFLSGVWGNVTIYSGVSTR